MDIKDKRKKILMIFIYVCIGILITLGGTYAYLNYGDNNNTATGTAHCNTINYTAQPINSSSLTSTNNYLQGNTATITLSYTSGCDIFTYANIYLYVNESTTAPIETNHSLKYKVFSGSTQIKEGTITNKGDTLLATVPLTTTSTTYKIYTWLDSSTSHGYYEGTTLSGYIYAKTEQLSTLDGFLIRDYSYNNNNGLGINAKWDQSATTITTDGVDDYINCELQNYNFEKKISLVTRLKLISTPTQTSSIITNMENSKGIGLDINTSNKLVFNLNNTTLITSSTTLSLNTWYTIVATYDGSSMKLYINGTQTATTNATAAINVSNFPIHISSTPTSSSNTNTGSNFVNASYSDVLIFKKALTQTEINNYYKSTISQSSVDKTDLLLYYNFTK